jgi:hypothetical protein
MKRGIRCMVPSASIALVLAVLAGCGKGALAPALFFRGAAGNQGAAPVRGISLLSRPLLGWNWTMA